MNFEPCIWYKPICSAGGYIDRPQCHALSRARDIIMRLFVSSFILLAACTGVTAASGQADPRSITVELSSFKFVPGTLTLERGRSYLIHFVNKSSGGHDYVAKEFFASATIAAEDQGKIVNGTIDVGGGDAVDVHLIPTRLGTYNVHCSHFMHSTFGMTGSVVVR